MPRLHRRFTTGTLFIFCIERHQNFHYLVEPGGHSLHSRTASSASSHAPAQAVRARALISILSASRLVSFTQATGGKSPKMQTCATMDQAKDIPGYIVVCGWRDSGRGIGEGRGVMRTCSCESMFWGAVTRVISAPINLLDFHVLDVAPYPTPSLCPNHCLSTRPPSSDRGRVSSGNRRRKAQLLQFGGELCDHSAPPSNQAPAPGSLPCAPVSTATSERCETSSLQALYFF